MEALRHYLGLHRANFGGAIKRLAGQPFASLLTILVIATALALPAGLRVAVNNAGAVSDSWQGAADFTVYLKVDVSEEAARRTARAIETRDDVASVTLIDRDAALAEFRARSGFGEALDALAANPLPHTLVVSPASGVATDVESGVGMQSMRERARELGGTLTISERDGGGTQVTASLPVGV